MRTIRRQRVPPQETTSLAPEASTPANPDYYPTGDKLYSLPRPTGRQPSPRLELAAILAAAYLRLLRLRAHNCQSQANLRPPDSPELSGYRVPPE